MPIREFVKSLNLPVPLQPVPVPSLSQYYLFIDPLYPTLTVRINLVVSILRWPLMSPSRVSMATVSSKDVNLITLHLLLLWLPCLDPWGNLGLIWAALLTKPARIDCLCAGWRLSLRLTGGFFYGVMRYDGGCVRRSRSSIFLRLMGRSLQVGLLKLSGRAAGENMFSAPRSCCFVGRRTTMF